MRDGLADDIRRLYDTSLTDYRAAMERTADFAASRHNLGNLEATLGRWTEAAEHYRMAVGIDDACAFLARFGNGSLATFESTRYARGHKALYTFDDRGFARRARRNQACWSEVWLTTSSVITRSPRAWASRRNSLKSASVP